MTEAAQARARRLLPLLDLTSLADGHDDDIAALCAKACTPHGTVAAVCSWPEHAAAMACLLADAGPRIAVVVNFPHGGTNQAAAVDEARRAVDGGAQELDLVWPYEAWLAGERAPARDLVSAVKAAGGPATLKVIMETGLFPTAEAMTEAGAELIAAGADFLKTSTGKIPQGATPEAARALLAAIHASGRPVGFKAAGGIRTVADAAVHLDLAEEIMGRGFVRPNRFRIGASRLLDEVLAILERHP